MAGRSTCAISLLADMCGLVLQLPVKFPGVISVKMHLVCWPFFVFVFWLVYFPVDMSLC